jgi:hypothetical protein
MSPQACTETQFSLALTCAGRTNFNPTVCWMHFNFGGNTDASHLLVYRISWPTHQCVLLGEPATLSVDAEAHRLKSHRLFDALLLGGNTDASHLGFIIFPGRPINAFFFVSITLSVEVEPLLAGMCNNLISLSTTCAGLTNFNPTDAMA